ncbi:MAG: hypothetical protein KGK33_08800 [Hyphomicrobiales bacterium]|nr:hypothetical protein [Hyphomicrobiales bacterium]
MIESAALANLTKAAKSYTRDIGELISAGSTTEPTYYPSVRSLISAALAVEDLPFSVRINTSEQKSGGGFNLPDVALYDSGGEYLVICGEVKLPAVEIDQLAISTENKDQIGRYLAATRAVLVTNVRAFGLVTVSPKWKGDGPVPPEARRIEQVAELWPSVSALKVGKAIEPSALDAFAELIEAAVTRFAPIAARITRADSCEAGAPGKGGPPREIHACSAGSVGRLRKSVGRELCRP